MGGGVCDREYPRVTLAFSFGLIPALAASAGLNDVLKQSARGATAGRRRFREAMVALEVAASLALLICAGLLILKLSPRAAGGPENQRPQRLDIRSAFTRRAVRRAYAENRVL